MIIEYVPAGSNNWVRARVHSRAGKATGKYRAHWNIITDDSHIKELNFDEVDWKVCIPNYENTEMAKTNTEEAGQNVQPEPCEMNVCEVFLSQVDKQTIDAKAVELKNWEEENVFDVVEDRKTRHYISALDGYF